MAIGDHIGKRQMEGGGGEEKTLLVFSLSPALVPFT